MNKAIVSLFVSVVCLIFTFPGFNLATTTGLDSSYTWGLNYLWQTNPDQLNQLVYPIGKLGFLKMPSTLGNTYFWATVFSSLIKLSLAFVFLIHLSKNKWKSTLFHSLIAFLLLATSGFDVALILLTLLLCFLALEKKQIAYLVAAVVLSVVSFSIKTSIGISCFSVLFFTHFILLFVQKETKQFFVSATISIIALFLVGFLIYGSYFPSQLLNGIKISSGYSSSLALHPSNNWWALAIFWIGIISIPFVANQQKISRLFVLSSAVFFMMWKHAMVREDASHNGILFYFTFCFILILIALASRKKIAILTLGIISLAAFHLNLSSIYGFNGVHLNYDGISNLTAFLDYKNTLKQKEDESNQPLESLTLTDRIREKIGENTIDFYPWEHAYAKQNKLNWHPRKTIEIGASSSQWSSQIASNHYKDSNSPQFILYHFYQDNYEGNLGSIDNRHILNDEPLVWQNILTYYKKSDQTDNFILFEKRKQPISVKRREITSVESQFNTWINLPQTEKHEVLFTKIDIPKSLGEKAQTFLYKDDLYLIDYKLKDGTVLTYHFTPNTAVDGLWCNPLLSNFNSYPQEVQKIRFRKIFYGNENGKINLEFLARNYSENDLLSQLNELTKGKIILSELQDFETLNPELFYRSSSEHFEGKYSNQLDRDGYSFTYRYSLDSIWSLADSTINSLQLKVQTLYKTQSKKSDLILEVKNSKGDFWISSQFNPSKNWNYKYTTKSITREYHAHGELIIYSWNKNEQPLWIDDFEIKIIEKSL